MTLLIGFSLWEGLRLLLVLFLWLSISAVALALRIRSRHTTARLETPALPLQSVEPFLNYRLIPTRNKPNGHYYQEGAD